MSRKPKSDKGLKSQAPKKIPTPELFLERFVEYVEKTKDNPFEVHDFVGKDGDEVYRKKQRCLTMEGFEIYLEDHYGIGSIQQYLENREGRYPEYLSIVGRVKKIIREDQISGGMCGVYNSNLTARLNGLSDNIQTNADSIKLLNIDPL